MNVLFLTMSPGIRNMQESGIYTDLMRKFRENGHEVYIVYPNERRSGRPTECNDFAGIHLLGVKTLNVIKANVIEKGIGQVLLEYQFKSAIKRYYKNIKFDLILYSTPPITFTKLIVYLKRCNTSAATYLLLKDIFPQNAVDIGMLKKSGVKGILYKMFRAKEKKLYGISDFIGCMSPANVDYLLGHNPEISKDKVEIAPNSYDIPEPNEVHVDRNEIRQKYGLPIDVPIFIYGGNMGKPQGIPFLIKCMEAVKDRNDCHFVIVGDGTEYPQLEYFVKKNSPKSVSLFRSLPKKDYDALAAACDVGLIFLDYRFSVPNYPSRLLPYLMEKKPIIAVTDPNCDMGSIAEANGYGFYCPSNSVDGFVKVVNNLLVSDIKRMGESGYQFFLNNYTTDHTYLTIIKHLNK